MNSFNYLFFLVFLSGISPVYSQIEFTAHDTIPDYNGRFRYGANMGAYYGWRDEQLADIAAGNPEVDTDGAGVDALRPLLSEWFLEYWGYDIRLDAFRHYDRLGIEDNVVFIGYPSEEHRDTTNYCPGTPSQLFANMYLPIWDDGENQTPVNDDNYYACYLWKMVTAYNDQVKYWEIWNEPDFDFAGHSSLEPGQPGNWWEYDPDPCLYALHAPVEHYVRMLRISYEVIKYIAPEDYVALGGIGYPSFLDVLLRNTDNPVDGSVDSLYPLTGGAYFDVVSYHSYPHIDNSLREWSDEVGGFVYSRNSDKCVDGFLNRQSNMMKVLQDYGYDGATYPEKRWLVTESNIPRVQTGEFIGSNEAQRNYLMKALIASQQHEIDQFHVYQLGDIRVEDGFSEFHSMGLYGFLDHTTPYNQKIHQAGIAYKTTSSLLRNRKYDPVKTAAMKLPEEVRGAAFRNAEGDYTFVLWAVTTLDRSEAASATYRFPSDFNLEQLHRREWDYSVLGITRSADASRLLLSGSPSFLTENKVDNPSPATQVELQCMPSPFSNELGIYLDLDGPMVSSLTLYDSTGRLIRQFFRNEHLAGGGHVISMSTGELSPGVYIMHFEERGGIQVSRRIVKR